MKITGSGSAGTAESGDALVVVEASASGIALELSGPSIARYGEEIRSEVFATLAALGIEAVTVRLQEKGALDCTIKARLAAACLRAAAPAGSTIAPAGSAAVKSGDASDSLVGGVARVSNSVSTVPAPSIPWEAMP